MAVAYSQRERAIGRSTTATRLPHPALQPLVERYWGWTEDYSVPIRRRELPSRSVVTVLGLGPPMRLRDARSAAGSAETQTSFVAGLTEASIVTEMDGTAVGLQLNLTPLGAFVLLGVPMHTFANRVTAFEDVLGRAGSELVERLADAPTWEARFALLDATLRARLDRSRQPTPSIAWAWRRLVQTGGRIAVRSLAEELGCSRKHLATRFREQVGLAPKAAARVLRFERAVAEILDGETRWGTLARACGYFDQAHFNRDFREFAGSTPTEFLARQLPDGLGLAPE